MGWFTRSKRHPGWLAVQLYEDRVDLVHCKPGTHGSPQVTLCDSFMRGQSPSATLSRLRKELALDSYSCTTLLPVDHYQLREIEAPAVPEAEMKAAVRWRVKDMIDYPVEAAVVDVLHVPPDPAVAAGSTALYAVIAREEDVRECASPFDTARLALAAVDIPELAQRNVAALFEPEDEGVAMLSFYASGGILTFTCGGELYVSRRIEIPLDRLMDVDEDVRTEHLARIALEVQRSLDHFGRQYRHVPLSKVLLGPLPQPIGMHDYLSAHLENSVESIDLKTAFDFSLVPDLAHAERQSQYLPALGAALRGMRDHAA